MGISNDELLAKAVFDTSGFGGVGEAPLAIEQVTSFIELMTAGQDMLPTVASKTSSAPKWQESILDFAGPITYPGVQGVRNTTGQRSAPITGVVEMNTVLVRAEIPVVDEVLEDNVAGPALAGSVERLIADRVGFDIEGSMVNGVFSNTVSSINDLLDGWLQQAINDGNVTDATSLGEDFQTIFKDLIISLPVRFRRNLTQDATFYVPNQLFYVWRDILSNRETVGGDAYLAQDGSLSYLGIPVTPVANIAVNSTTSDILLAHKSNLYAGFQRAMKFETYRDPREGAMSFIVTARYDAKVAVPQATAIATNVTVS